MRLSPSMWDLCRFSDLLRVSDRNIASWASQFRVLAAAVAKTRSVVSGVPAGAACRVVGYRSSCKCDCCCSCVQDVLCAARAVEVEYRVLDWEAARQIAEDSARPRLAVLRPNTCTAHFDRDVQACVDDAAHRKVAVVAKRIAHPHVR